MREEFSHGCRCTLPVGCIQAETGQKIEERETPPFAFRPGSRLVETIGTARISKRRGSSGSCLFGPASFSSSIQERTSPLLSWLLLVMLVVSDESGGKMLWQDEADP